MKVFIGKYKDRDCLYIPQKMISNMKHGEVRLFKGIEVVCEIITKDGFTYRKLKAINNDMLVTQYLSI